MMTEMLELIDVDPSVVHGQARFRGTRIPVSVVLDCLASGMSEAAIQERYPTLSMGTARAALAYAAMLAREELYPLDPVSR